MANRLALAAVFIGGLFVTTGAAQPARAPQALEFPALVAESRRLVEDDWRRKDYPGIAIAVSVDGRTIWSEGFGFADLEHRVPMTPRVKFRVGSISKPMTAAAVMTLVESGRLDLDVPIQRYVSVFPEKRFPITTRQLGGHLAGVRHYEGNENFIRDPYPSVSAALSIFKEAPLVHEPGTAFLYTSHGYNLLSAVVEGASGRDFLSYMREAVFRPLGMRDTVADFVTSLIPNRTAFYRRDEDGAVVNAPYVDNSYKWAGGGFLSTTEDVLRFGNAHFDDRLLSAEARAILFTEQQTTEGEGTGYGLGWFVRTDDRGRRVWSHSGGSVGGTSLLVMQPETRVVVVGLINLTRADNEVVRRVFDRVVDAVDSHPEGYAPSSEVYRDYRDWIARQPGAVRDRYPESYREHLASLGFDPPEIERRIGMIARMREP